MFTVILLFLLSILTTQAETIDKIVAVVGDKIITQYDIETFNPKKIRELYALKDENLKKKMLLQYKYAVRDILVNQAVLEIAAAKHGVKVSDEETEAALEKVLKQNNITRDELEVLLMKENMTLPQYKMSIKKDIFQARLKSRVIDPMIIITNDDIKKKIDKYEDEMGFSDSLELRMILLDNSTSTKEVFKYLEKHSFSDAAIKFSKDKTAKSGGYLGWLKVNRMNKDLQEATKGKRYGDIFIFTNSKGQKMMFKVEGYKSKYDIDPETRKKLVDELQKEKFEEVFNAWLEKQKKQTYIHYIE